MKFCDLVQFMHHNYEVKKNAAEFVKILTDAILDDEALEKAAPNPLYGLGKSTLEVYYSGRLPISQKKASALTPRIDEAKFTDFVNTYSFYALNHMKDKLVEFGFEVEPSEVGQACADILAQIIRHRSEGLSDDVPSLPDGTRRITRNSAWHITVRSASNALSGISSMMEKTNLAG